MTRCASVVGPAPYGDGGLPADQWFDGMVEGNVHEFGWALEGEHVLRPELEREAPALIASLDSESDAPLGQDYTLSDADLAVMQNGAFRAVMAASVQEAIGRSVDGVVDDDLAFAAPWGFDVAAISVPVAVWYGPHDTLVPTAHGEWLAKTIPGAEVVVLDGGHFAVHERMPELLAWLTRASRAGRVVRRPAGRRVQPAARPARLTARAVLVRLSAADADGADHAPVAGADHDRPGPGDERQPRHLTHGGHERGALLRHLAQRMPIAVPDRGALGLGLGDLSAERRCPVHAVQRLDQAALIHDGDRHGDPQGLGMGLRRLDHGAGISLRDRHAARF